MTDVSGGRIADASGSGWVRSSRCANSGCVEVKRIGDVVALRDSVDGTEIRFDLDSWKVFMAGVKAGEFDHLTS